MDVRVSQVTNIHTVYKVKWCNVALAAVWLFFISWMIGFPFYIIHLGDKFSGRCLSDTGFDEGERTTHMLGSLIWMHGTWIFLLVLSFLHDHHADWFGYFLLAELLYIIVSFIAATVIGYIVAAPDACFMSHRDMYVLLIFANLLYMIVAGAIVLLLVTFACIGSIHLCSQIPSFFFEKETVELPA